MNNTMDKIIRYFEENEEVFNNCIEELDSWNGYLGDDRYYEMELLQEFYRGVDPIELLNRAYFGHDAETWTTDAYGNKTYGAFNPNREYFYYNGYGNLVSADYKDYSHLLDAYVVDAMNDNRMHIDTIEGDEELTALFDEFDFDPFNDFCENQETCNKCPFRDCKNTIECRAEYEKKFN